MCKTERVLLGMSGGVDSSVAAVLLQKDGFEVVGCTLWLHGDMPHEAEDAAKICEKLGIEHIVLDFRAEFEACVMKDFIEQYLCGNTPNPCIVCNRYIKFEKMLRAADEHNCKYIATGHYAVIGEYNSRSVIYKPEDKAKEQTYVLYSLTQEQLSRTLFPLASVSKARVREIAAEYGFENANKKDSQDICFIPDGNYAAFIERKSGVASKKGNFVDRKGNVLGEHNGIINYTVGQRKGLGIALGKPAFVLSKDAKTDRIVLDTDEQLLFSKRVFVKDTNYLPFDKLTEPIKVNAKLRYRHEAQPALLIRNGENGAIIEFDEPQRAASPGQSAVFYDGDMLLGGGIIEGENDE